MNISYLRHKARETNTRVRRENKTTLETTTACSNMYRAVGSGQRAAGERPKVSKVYIGYYPEAPVLLYRVAVVLEWRLWAREADRPLTCRL